MVERSLFRGDRSIACSKLQGRGRLRNPCNNAQQRGFRARTTGYVFLLFSAGTHRHDAPDLYPWVNAQEPLPRSVFRDQSAVEMRIHSRLPSAEFALLSRTSPTGRTSDGEYLFW